MGLVDFSFVHARVDDGVATLLIDRPGAGNALNPALVHQLHQAVTQAAEDPQTRGIVVAGANGAFVAGADVAFFLRGIDAGAIDRIVRFTSAAHAMLNTIETCSKPVVARVDGPAVGGGVELALACHRIVASRHARFTMPEVGLGIYPGMGGTQRTPRRIGLGLAKWLVLSSATLTASDALAIGLVDQLVNPQDIEAAARQTALAIGASGSVARGPRDPSAVPEQWAAMARFFERHRAESMEPMMPDLGKNPHLVRAVTRVCNSPRLALRLAERLMEEGLRGTLCDGLKMECEHLHEVFGTAEARQRLGRLAGDLPSR